MNEIKEFTYEDVKNADTIDKGDMLRRYHKWLKEKREEDKKELNNLKNKIYRAKNGL